MKPYYQDEWVTIYNADCREVIPQLDINFDLLLSDPPYGSGLSMEFNDRFTHAADNWWKNTDRSTCKRHDPVIGDDKPFDPAPFLKYPQIILWGANYYSSRLPDSGGWLIWDKRHGVEDAEWPMSDAELAWTNIRKAVKIFRHRWFGLLRESEQGQHYHPTQKPVALMKWCIQQAKDVNYILDPYMGSGPVLRAAKDFGIKAVGVELKKKYCDIAIKRLQQTSMKIEIPVDEQIKKTQLSLIG